MTATTPRTAARPSESPDSGKVEAVFEDWFRSQGQPVSRAPFDGRSDYVGFTLRGIPSGGIYAGAEGVKTAEEEQIFGGAAGSWYDPCYHQICDNLSTVFTGVMPLSAEGLAPTATDAESAPPAARWPAASIKSLRELSAAAAYAVYYYADSKDAFGTKPGGHKPPKRPHRGGRWHGHGKRVGR